MKHANINVEGHLIKIWKCKCGNEQRRQHLLSQEERFWNYIDVKNKDECWKWLGSLSVDGYGHFNFNGKITGAHRVSYIINFGRIPEKLHVLHKCNNPICVNPNHLYLGTHGDNVRQCFREGRGKTPLNIGEKNGSAKLTWNDIIKIRELYRTGKFSQQKLADMFGVSRTAIYFIVTNKHWIT